MKFKRKTLLRYNIVKEYNNIITLGGDWVYCTPSSVEQLNKQGYKFSFSVTHKLKIGQESLSSIFAKYEERIFTIKQLCYKHGIECDYNIGKWRDEETKETFLEFGFLVGDVFDNARLQGWIIIQAYLYFVCEQKSIYAIWRDDEEELKNKLGLGTSWV